MNSVSTLPKQFSTEYLYRTQCGTIFSVERGSRPDQWWLTGYADAAALESRDHFMQTGLCRLKRECLFFIRHTYNRADYDVYRDPVWDDLDPCPTR